MDTDNQKQPVQEPQTDPMDAAANQAVVEEEVARETVASAEPTSESDLSAQVIDSASELRSALTRISRRSGLSRLLVDLSLLWLVYALAHGVWLYAGGVAPTGNPQLFWKISASCFLAIGLIRTLFLIALRPNIQQVAERIEFEQKDLKAALLTAVGELKNTQPGSWVWLREKLFRETLLKSRGGAWESTGIAALFLTQLLHVWAFLVAALVFYVGYGKVMTAPDPGQLEIFPGDAEIERGSRLLVRASFPKGNPPDEATLVLKDMSGNRIQESPMVKNLEDPVFAFQWNNVLSNFTYAVEYQRRTTPTFTVQVYDPPELLEATAEIIYPDYSHKEPETIERTRRLALPEGSEFAYTMRFNQPMSSVQWVDENGETLELKADPDFPEIFRFPEALRITADSKAELKFLDTNGREPSSPTEFNLSAILNKRPNLKWIFPKGDREVTPLEEWTAVGQATDDFGLVSYGMGYSFGEDKRRFVDLSEKETESASDEKNAIQLNASFERLFSMEALEAEPDDLLTYFLWADDLGPDGEVRRTEGELFFAQTRPFEQIFREDNSGAQDQSESQNSSQGEEEGSPGAMAQSQKDIISATWNLRRAFEAGADLEKTRQDIQVIEDAQTKLLNQNTESAKAATDPTSVEALADAEEAMAEAIRQLYDAKKSDDPTEALTKATEAEQSAYEALLRLRANEFLVSRSRSNSSSSQGGGERSPEQQALDQMEFASEENRYETRSQAAPLENEEARENVFLLDRLKDLAQRQEDINEQLQEIQTVEDIEEEEEALAVEERLKKLREEQEELLEDLDEVNQRMAQSGTNPAERASSQEQLEQTRESALETMEAMEQGEVSKALASGNEARENLDEVRNEFRRETSSSFAEAMSELRESARELTQSQQELRNNIEQLKETQSNAPTGGLRNPDRTQASAAVEEQDRRIAEFMNELKDLTEEAEAAEPLLSRSLYDAYRQAAQNQLTENFERMRDMLDFNFTAEALELEEAAAREVTALTEAVDAAADRILGDDVEALRTAQSELEELRQDIESEMTRELAQASPGQPGQGQPGQGQPGQGQPGQGQPGQGQPGQGQPGQGQPGQGQPGQGQPGQGQPGQGQPGQGSRPGILSTAMSGGVGGSGGRPSSPLTGDDFSGALDRLRDAEEMVDVEDLQREISRVIEAAKDARSDYRSGKSPQWDLVVSEILEPLASVRDSLREEIARRDPSQEELIAIDRDPAPSDFKEATRRYFERLSSARVKKEEVSE